MLHWGSEKLKATLHRGGLHSSDLFTWPLGECKQFSLSDFTSLKGLSVNTNGY